MITVGSVALTPFEPQGQVLVLELFFPGWPKTKPLALVRFLHDHYGYRAGSEGIYYLDELTEEPDGNTRPTTLAE